MTQGQIVRKPWKRRLAGLRELADWAGVSRPAIHGAIQRSPDFPVPLDHLSMGNVYDFQEAVSALRRLGFTEGGGGREWGITRKNSEGAQRD